MARLPMYEQQTTAQSQRATPQAFGAGTAEAQGGFGATLADIGASIQRRSEVIDRVRLMSGFDAEAMRMMEAAQTEGDITSDETLSNLHGGLRQLAEQSAQNHKGTSASRAELKAQLENQVGQYYKSALGTQIKAQKNLIAENFEQSVNTLSISVMQAPELLNDVLVEAENKLTELRPGMTAQEEQLYRANMRSRLAQSTIEGFYNRGDHEQAMALLNDETVGKFLDPNVARTMTIKVVSEQARVQIEARKQDQRVQSFSARLGRPLSAQEEMRARSLPSDKKDMTLADEIAELELVQGRAASQQQVDKMAGTYVAPPSAGGSGASSSMFGNSLRGRSLQMVNEGAMMYAAGMLDSDQARQFEMAAAEAYSPVERQDPITGQFTRYQPTVPPFVQDALQRGSGAYGTAPMPLGRPAVGGGAPQGMIGQGQQMTPGAGEGAPSSFATAAADQPPPQAPQAEQGRTIWDRRQNIAGPVAGVRAGVQRIPGVGPPVAGAVFGEGETRQADADRTFVDNASRDLIRILQNNPRFAEGERQAIEKEVSVGPEFFRSVDSYEGRLMGVAESLAKRREDAQRILQTETSGDQRKWAMDSISAIDNFHLNLGVPRLITDPSQLEGLPPGTPIMDKKGNEYRTR